MKNIIFCVQHFSESGTCVAVYDYAHYNETVLKNKSYICTFSDELKAKLNILKSMISYEKFKNRFEVIVINDIHDITDTIKTKNIHSFYTLTVGSNIDCDFFKFSDKSIWLNCKTIKHCVFDTSYPDGDIYCSISESVNKQYNTCVPVLPHITPILPNTDKNLRQVLTIPENATVFGRYGSYCTFNIWNVVQIVNKVAKEHPNIYFLFMNTGNDYFEKCNNIIFLNTNIDPYFKTLFINTCDAMLHARKDGESFGLSCAEFASKNKNIISALKFNDSYYTAHFDILQDKIIPYNTIAELEDILLHFDKYKKDMTINGYKQFTPEYVMNIFKNLLDSPVDNSFKKVELSIGILTYNSPTVLKHTLETYKNSGFLDISDDIFCISQMSPLQMDEKSICESYGIRCICLPDNGKMGSGFKTIYDNAKYEYILFLENDFGINVNKSDVKYYIEDALHLLKNCNVDVVRGRNIQNAGEPNHGLNLKNLPHDIIINHEHLSETIYWIDNPSRYYPDKIFEIEAIHNIKKWYKTSSYSCAYTNNPYICTKDFFKKNILPFCTFNSIIEIIISPFWRSNNFQCAFGHGIFTHNRCS
jgi:hypothetical protein